MFIDILCAILIGSAFYLGYSKGIIKSIFGIISILIAFLVSLKFSFLIISLIEKVMDSDPRLNVIIGFVLTFLLVMVGIRLIGKGFEKILETAHINFINKLAGGLVSALIVLILYSSAILFMDRLKLFKAATKAESHCYTYLEAVPEKSKWLINSMKPIFSEFWEKTQKAIDRADKDFPKKEDSKKEEGKEQVN
jgi:membrane protein required for colicin V production